jgi:hypothetical protein
MQVMLTRNWPQHRLVNGSRGVLVGFAHEYVENQFGVPPGEYAVPIVRFTDENSTGDSTVRVLPVSQHATANGGSAVRIQVRMRRDASA